MISSEALTESITKLSIIVCTDSDPRADPEFLVWEGRQTKLKETHSFRFFWKN